MNFEIYAYWNTVELAGVFNAVAAITNSGDFNGLLRTMTLIMLLSLSIVVLAGRGMLTDMWKWVILVAIFNGIMLVPKTNVIIVDRVGTAPTQVIANVPLGLASTAHTISKIGDWLTTSFEAVFSLPDDLRFRKNGTLFGHRVMAEKLTQTISNSTVNDNFVEFYRECVMPELALKGITFESIVKTNDIWSVLSNANNMARLVTLVDPSSNTSSTIGCDQAVTALNGQLNTEASNKLSETAGKFFPGLTQAVARANLSSALQTTDQYQMGLSWSATSAIKQAQVANAVIDAQYLIPAQMGDAATASVNLDMARAIRSTNQSYALMAKLATSTMPKVRNIVELTLYAIFPLVVLIVVAAGHYGGMAFRGYVTSLIWVQLWPPLYAVMHYAMTLHSQELATATQGLGASLFQYAYVNDAIITDQAIAGFMSATAIPGLAWALAQGMVSGVQGMVSAMGSSTAGGRDVEKIGSAGGLGNRQSGSFSENTANYDNVSAHQHNMAPLYRDGAARWEDVGRSGIITATAADGTVTVDASAIQHKTNFRMTMGSQAANSYQKQSEIAETAATGEAFESATTWATTLQKSTDFVKTHGKGSKAGTQDAVSDQTGFNQAVTKANEITNGFTTERKLNQTQKAQIMTIAEASGGADIGIAALKATMKVTGENEAAAAQTLGAARQHVKKTGFSDVMNKIRTASHNQTFDTGDESSVKAMAGIRAGLDESKNRSEKASANYTKSLSLKESATRTRANSETFDAGMIRPFMEWMMTQDDKYNGGKFKPETLAWIMEHAPMDLVEDKNRFFKEVVEPRLADEIGELKTPEDVQKFLAVGKDRLLSREDIKDQGQRQIGQVAATAKAAGVDPNASVVSAVPGQVAAAENVAGQAIAAGKSEIDAQGKPLEKKATEGTDPTKQNLLGIAAANTIAKVAPDGTVWGYDQLMSGLKNKTGVVDLTIPDNASVAKPTVENYKGNGWTAGVETGLFVGSFFVGGPVAGKLTGGLSERSVGWIAKREGAKAAEKAATSAAVKAEAGAAGRAAAAEVQGAAALIGPPTQAVAQAAAKAEADLAVRMATEKAMAEVTAKAVGAAREAEILAGGQKAGYGVGRVLFTEAVGWGANKGVIPAIEEGTELAHSAGDKLEGLAHSSGDKLKGLAYSAGDKLKGLAHSAGDFLDGKENANIRRAIGDALPKLVDDAIEKALNGGEQAAGELIGTRSPAPADKHPGQPQAIASRPVPAQGEAVTPAPAHRAESQPPVAQGELRPVDRAPASAPADKHPGQPQAIASRPVPAQGETPDSAARTTTELANVTARAESAEARVGEIERLIQARNGEPRADAGGVLPVSGVPAQAEPPQGHAGRGDNSIFTAEAGTSNLGKILAPRQRQAPQQPQENAESTKGKGDAPPPSGR